MRLNVVGTWTGGPMTYVNGIQDSITQTVAGEIRHYTASGGNDGGILSWIPAEAVGVNAGMPVDSDPLAQSSSLGAPTGLEIVTLNGRAALIEYGAAGAAVTGHWIAADGTLSGGFRMATGAGEILALETVETATGSLFYSTARGGAGVTIWQLGSNNQLSQMSTFTVADSSGGGPIGAGDLVALEALRLGGQDVLLVASAGGTGGPELISLAVNASGTLSEIDRVGAEAGLQIAAPTALSLTRVDGQDYALLAAAGSSSISVVALAADGRMTVTDQVNDDLGTRFQSISVLETISVGDQVFVLAGGGDDGLSVLQLLPGGRLLHRTTIADTTEITLANVSSLGVTYANGSVEVFATSESETGVTHLRLDLGPLGQTEVGGAAADLLTGSAGGDVLSGGGGDDLLRGLDGDDILMDGAGVDVLWGGAGADVFVFSADGAIDHVMDFQLGIDRLDLSGLGRAYSLGAFELESTADGMTIRFGGEEIRLHTVNLVPIDPADLTIASLVDLWHVLPASAPDPPDQPIDPRHVAVETIEGTSGDDLLRGTPEDSAFDPLAAQIYRLYQATLGRAPDATGLNDWVGRLAEGWELRDVAAGFTNSIEFTQRYGATTDGEFVTLLYSNVLERAPDPTGFSGWTGRLADGSLSRVDLVTLFSESPEFVGNTEFDVYSSSRGGLEAGWTDEVYRLYRATLGRDPDATGLNDWMVALAEGRALNDVVAGFTNSIEFTQRYGATTDGEFVTLLYSNVLERAPDPTGFSGWTGRLADGSLSRVDLVLNFSESPEFVGNTEAAITTYIHGLGTDDRIIGGSGDDLLFGGALRDVFVFDTLQPSLDRVIDLEPWDMIALDGFGYVNASEALSHMSAVEQDVVFSDQGITITFLNTGLGDFSQEMFWLG